MRTKLTESECLAILGVSASSPMDVVTEAYRYHRAANHPDKFQSERHKAKAEEEFKRITAAYERLLEIRKGTSSSASERQSGGAKTAEGSHWGRMSRWLHWWWRWRFFGAAGPPPRSSRDTREQWPHLKRLHERWLFPGSSPTGGHALRLTIARAGSLPQSATEYAHRAQVQHLDGDLYWVSEDEQSANVCYLRFLHHLIGDLYARVEVVLSKQKHLTCVELGFSTTLWWHPVEMLRRCGRRFLALLPWLGFSIIAEVFLTSGTGGAALGTAIAGLLVIVWMAHLDFHVDYVRVDWPRVYPFRLWWSRFALPAMFHVAGFFLWRYWANVGGHDPGARVVYLPVLIWSIGYWIWKSVRLVDYPEAALGPAHKSKAGEAYFEAIRSLFTY